MPFPSGPCPAPAPAPAQGQYSFALFDGDKRCVFAARDSSGSEPLFYDLAEDGALRLSNSQPPLPADEGAVQERVQVRRPGLHGDGGRDAFA